MLAGMEGGPSYLSGDQFNDFGSDPSAGHFFYNQPMHRAQRMAHPGELGSFPGSRYGTAHPLDIGLGAAQIVGSGYHAMKGPSVEQIMGKAHAIRTAGHVAGASAMLRAAPMSTMRPQEEDEEEEEED